MKKNTNLNLRFTGVGGFFIESNPHKQKYNKQKCGANMSTIGKINNIHCLSISSILTVINKHTIPEAISFVKVINNISMEGISTKLGVINATPNQPAERFMNNPENALSQGLVRNLSTLLTLTNEGISVNQRRQEAYV